MRPDFIVGVVVGIGLGALAAATGSLVALVGVALVAMVVAYLFDLFLSWLARRRRPSCDWCDERAVLTARVQIRDVVTRIHACECHTELLTARARERWQEGDADGRGEGPDA